MIFSRDESVIALFFVNQQLVGDAVIDAGLAETGLASFTGILFFGSVFKGFDLDDSLVDEITNDQDDETDQLEDVERFVDEEQVINPDDDGGGDEEDGSGKG